jgi:DNA-binding response OmpR family regulator
MVVFIVEPDKFLAESYAQCLRVYKDMHVKVFHTARMALRCLEKVIPDVILLEIALPVHNGFEFLYELRSYSDTRNVRIVVNSFIQPESIEWGFVNRGDLGISHHLHKTTATLQDIQKAVL